MADISTPNLPSRDFEATSAFFAKLRFESKFRDAGWMILTRGSLSLEFFLYQELDPAQSWFSCCFRLEHLDIFYSECRDAGIPESHSGFPRLHRPKLEESGMRIGYLVDPDGTLIRLIQN